MRSALRILVAALAVLALVSCGARREASAAKEAAPAYAAPPSPDAEPSGGGEAAAAGSALPATRMVIKTATLSVKVKVVGDAFARAVALAEERGGYVQSSTMSTENGTYAQVSLRIPPEGFLPLIASLEGLGVALRKSISGQDVTEEYFDLKAELENEREVRSRLFDLLKKAGTVEDAIKVEVELERVGATVNKIVGRMKYLETMVGLSSVDLTLFEEATYTPVRETFLNWSEVGAGFWKAAQVLVRCFFFLLQSLVVVIPLAAIVTAVVLAVRKTVRGRRRGKAKQAG